MIKEIQGNLIQLSLEGKFDVIAHGCNCHCTMSAGIAGQIAKFFPDAYKVDLQTPKGDIYKLGEFSKIHIRQLKLTIFNLYTQYDTGNNFEYTALALSIRNMIETLMGDEKIGLPMIGSGIVGGNWYLIKQILNKELSDFDVTIVKYLP